MAVVYRKPDGTFTSDRSYAHHVSPWDVVQSWVQFSDISPRFIVGSAKHESNYTINERDVGDQGDGSDSDGIMQISAAEARSVGLGWNDLFTLDGNLEVFARLMDRNRKLLNSLAPGREDSPDFRYYLALSHNQGQEAARKTIQLHGMDMATYTRNNGSTVKPGFNGPNIVAYYTDAATGGPDYHAEWDALQPDSNPGGGGILGPLVGGIAAALGLKWLLDRYI